MKIGAITIGQAPREDVTCDVLPFLGEGVILLQAGGLDGLSKEEIAQFQPEQGYQSFRTEPRSYLRKNIFFQSCSPVSGDWKSRGRSSSCFSVPAGFRTALKAVFR